MNWAATIARGRWIVVAVVVAVAAAALLVAANQLLALRAHLAEAPAGVRWLWWGLAAAALAGLGAAVWRALPRPPRERERSEAPRVDEQRLRADLAAWSGSGVDTAEARGELAELDRRRAGGEVIVAVHGEISAGKSSLIRALLPEQEIAVDVRGGTTRSVTHYRWPAPGGATLVLADLPGFGEAETSERLASDEATRAHAVLFVVDGDLTRSQWRAAERLRRRNKALVVALNKCDRYSAADIERIRARVAARLGGDTPVVPVRAGGREEVIRREADGSERTVVRDRAPDLRGLRRALQRAVDHRGDRLEAARDQAVLLLTARKLEGAVAAHRRDAADALADRYARRAVVGAMAAVAPGSDLVIQGALAAGLVRELCSLYRVPVREIAVDRLIASLRERAPTTAPLLLGVAGNALKAFPGVGTLTGGVIHAVAYGLLFRNIGAAVADSLAHRGELDAADAMERFEETLSGDLEPSARALATVAAPDAEGGGRDTPDTARGHQ